MRKLTYLLLMLLLFYGTVNATHIRGGNITYRQIDPQRPVYEITVTGYADTDSPVLFGSNGILDYGDGTEEVINNQGDGGYIPRTKFSDATWKYTLTRIHTYSEEGHFTISFRELYRNEGVLNMDNSINMPFYIESLLIVSPEFQNNSVQIKGNPQFIGKLNQTYHFNPQPYDLEGDSLSYHLVIVKQDKDEAVLNYRLPHKTFPEPGQSQTGEKAYFIMNPISGDLIWDAPNENGEYNFAFEVLEWRKIKGDFVLVGKVTQDMQLIVNDLEYPAPQIVFPVERQEIPIEKGSQWELTIEATSENPEETVVLFLSGDLLLKKPELIPGDSTGGLGKASITIRYTHAEEENVRYQLVATSFILYDQDQNNFRLINSTDYHIHSSYPVSRTVFLSASYEGPELGEEPLRLNNGIEEEGEEGKPPLSVLNNQQVKFFSIYPNPAPPNHFYVNETKLDKKDITLSLFDLEGKLAYHEDLKAFSNNQPIILGRELTGYFVVVIREGNQIYTSRILFSR